MWELQEIGGVKLCTHSKGSSGMSLMMAGMLMLAIVGGAYYHGGEIELNSSRRRRSAFDTRVNRSKPTKINLGSDTFLFVGAIPGVLLAGLGFILAGVETKLTLNPMKNTLVYDYNYGFGSSHKEFSLDDVIGLQFIRIYVTLVTQGGGGGAMGFGGERKVGSRIDGSLNLLVRTEGLIPLITIGDGDMTSQGARQLRDFLDLELDEATEERKEYVHRRHH